MKGIEVKTAPKEEQVKMVNDGGLEICRKLGHLKNKHYNTRKNRVEIRCSRCGKLLKVLEEK